MITTLDLRSCVDLRDVVHRAVQALVEGHVVGLPTESTYLWAASGLAPAAVETLRRIDAASDPTRRSSQRITSPTLCLPSCEAVEDYVCHWRPMTRRLATRMWPGPLVLSMRCDRGCSAASQLPPSIRTWVWGDDDSIAFRVIEHRVVADVHRLLSAPLVAIEAVGERTSATTAGELIESAADVATSEAVVDAVPAGRVVLVLDDGPTRYRGGATVVHADDRSMRTVRPGNYDANAMKRSARPLVAVVCTGNTCRSPMAEVMLRDRITRKLGDRVDVVSAGLAAGAGMPASPQGVEVMTDRGLDLANHRSRPLDESIINRADLVLTLTRAHRAAILTAWPTMAERVHTLRHDGGDVADPVGAPIDVYAACADQIEAELDAWVGHIETLLPSHSDGVATAATGNDEPSVNGTDPESGDGG